MSLDTLQWLVDIVVVVLVGSWWRMSARIDQIKDNYVRRDDFADHLRRLEGAMDTMNEKLDRLIARDG